MSYRDDYRYPYEQSEVKDENPMTPSTKCPKCGAEAFTSNAAVTEFHCGSTLYSESFVCRNSGFERFNPSHLCELTTLRASLAKAVEALKEISAGYADSSLHRTVARMQARASAVLKEISKDL